jgi:hypothetical protein
VVVEMVEVQQIHPLQPFKEQLILVAVAVELMVIIQCLLVVQVDLV